MPAQAAAVSEAAATIVPPNYTILPKDKKPIKQWEKLRQQIKELRKAFRDADSGKKTVLVILAIVVAMALLFLVMASPAA